MIYPVKSDYISGVPLSAPAYVPEINEQPVESIEQASKRQTGKKGIADYNDSFEDVSRMENQRQWAIKIRQDEYVKFEEREADSAKGVEAAAGAKAQELQAAISAQMLSLIRA